MASDNKFEVLKKLIDMLAYVGVCLPPLTLLYLHYIGGGGPITAAFVIVLLAICALTICAVVWMAWRSVTDPTAYPFFRKFQNNPLLIMLSPLVMAVLFLTAWHLVAWARDQE